MKTIITLFFMFTVLSAHAMTKREAECGIWLCMPTGFGTGCSESKSAFKDRVKHFKPALPDFAGCMFDNGSEKNEQTNELTEKYVSDFTSKQGRAAYIPEHEICTSWGRRNKDERYCLESTTIPEQYLKGSICTRDRDSQQTSPKRCTATFNFVDTFVDGVQYGETFYW